MTILPDIRALLRRPLVQQPAPPTAPPAKGKPASVESASPPVTEAELLNAGARLDEQRQAARAAIVEAGARRERLLETDGTIEAIEAVDREITSANIMLERIDRLAPDVANKLADVRSAAEEALFRELQAGMVAAGRSYIALLRDLLPQLAAESAKFTAAQDLLASAFKSKPPPIPRDFPSINEADIDRYESKLQGFSTLLFRANPPPVALRFDTGMDPGRFAQQFGSMALIGQQPSCKIKMLTNEPAGDGRWHKAGTVIEVPGADAERLIKSGRAEIVHEEAA